MAKEIILENKPVVDGKESKMIPDASYAKGIKAKGGKPEDTERL